MKHLRPFNEINSLDYFNKEDDFFVALFDEMGLLGYEIAVRRYFSASTLRRPSTIKESDNYPTYDIIFTFESESSKLEREDFNKLTDTLDKGMRRLEAEMGTIYINEFSKRKIDITIIDQNFELR